MSVYGVEDFRQGVPVDASYPVTARIGGVIRGLLRDGVPVKQGDRIADVDPRGTTDDLDHLSDKSRRVAEGVLEALLGLIAETSKRRPAPKKKTAARGKKAGAKKTAVKKTAASSARKAGAKGRPARTKKTGAKSSKAS